jgi:glycosyltransferase involved in cell wall biosynthesis
MTDYNRHHSSPSPAAPEISVIVPVHNEEPCLPELQRRLSKVLSALDRTFEIVYVDDGSTDRSLLAIREFAGQSDAVRYCSFTRNFGQAAAIAAGQRMATGQAVICIDADLQNPPEEIPKLLAKYDEGYELVYGIRRNRQDNWLRRLGSRTVTTLLNWMAGLPVDMDVTAFVVVHRRIIDALNACPERTRFYPALCAWLGARTTHVPVEHARRHAGQTKYSFWKLFRVAADLLTGFSIAPLRFAALLGGMFAVFGLALAVWVVISRVFSEDMLLGWSSTIATISVLGGIQLLTIGVLGEYVGRSFAHLQQRPLFVVRETSEEVCRSPQNRAERDMLVAPADEELEDCTLESKTPVATH